MERGKAALHHRVYRQREAWRPPLIDVDHLVVVPSSLRSNDSAVTVVTKMPFAPECAGKNRYFVMAITAWGVKRESSTEKTRKRDGHHSFPVGGRAQSHTACVHPLGDRNDQNSNRN